VTVSAPSVDELVRLLASRSVRTGHFVLASGRTSDLYIDARLTTMSPDGLALVGALGLQRIQRDYPGAAAVGGLTLGADPIAYAIALTSATAPTPLRAFSVRKEAKSHGTGQLVEGPLRSGDPAVVVEDVITTGASALRAAAAVEQFGATVLGVLAVVDREEGGREAIEARGFRVCALTRRGDFRL
jgi:orotate phosphoribosyltransferase